MNNLISLARVVRLVGCSVFELAVVALRVAEEVDDGPDVIFVKDLRNQYRNFAVWQAQSRAQ